MCLRSIVFYTIPTVSRGFIFAVVCLGSQKIVKQALLDFIFCKYEKNKEINQIQLTPKMPLSDENKAT